MEVVNRKETETKHIGYIYRTRLESFSSYRPRVIYVPMNEAGIIPAAVRAALDEAYSQGTHVKFIYTILNFQNSAGVTLAAERRRELLEIAWEYDLIILEDNTYGMLRFEGEAPPPWRHSNKRIPAAYIG